MTGNPKSEARNPKQIQSSKPKGSKQPKARVFWISSLFRLWCLFRISGFGFRIWPPRCS